MKNEIKYGLLIGILSGIWLLVMHAAGVYSVENTTNGRTSWLEYVSVIIPLAGLTLGIKALRDRQPDGKIEFFQGLVAGFKILLIGGIITAFFTVVYIQYVPSSLQTSFMGRIAAAGIVGLLLNIAVALSLMNKQKNL